MNYFGPIYNCLTAAIFLIIAAVAHAQPSATRLNSESYSFRHLLQNSASAGEVGEVRSLVQDGEGNIWIGGAAGLARFDGLDFKFFKIFDLDNAILRNKSVRSLVTDQNGVLWINTDRGLHIYKPDDEKFKTVVGLAQGEEASPYNFMAVSGDRHIWLVGDDIVARMDINSHEIQPALNTGSQNSPLINKKLTVAFEDSDRRLWLGTKDSEIFVFDQSGKLLRHWMHNPNHLSSLIDMHIMQDRDGSIWASAKGAGVIKISRDLDDVLRFSGNGAEGALPNDNVTGIGQDAAGQVWLAIDHAGLTLYDKTTHQFRLMPHSGNDHMAPASDQPQGLFVDNQGDLWVVHYPRGIDYLGGVNLNIARYRHNALEYGSLSHNAVNTIYQDRADRIWVGSESGLNLFDAANHKFQSFFSGSVITAVAENEQGNIWVGTWADGLYLLKDQGQAIRLGSSEKGYFDTFIWSLSADQQGLWIGTGSKGLARYLEREDKFIYYSHDGKNPRSISANTVWAILDYDAESLLIATELGLNQFSKLTGEFARIGANDSFFKSENIRCLIKLNNGHIWLGTTGGGITVLDEHLKPIRNFGVDDGLPSHSVNGLAQDRQGMVWAITSAGAVYINPVTFELITLTRDQGLSGNYFNRNAIMVDREGSTYLGSAAGLSVIKPQSLIRNLPKSVARINRLFLSNREVTPDTPNSSLTKSMLVSDTLTLDYHAALVGIGFSTINLRGGENVRFRYRLDDVDKDWISAGHDRRANYTNLPSGTHRFRVQAGDEKQYWPESEDKLMITVLPPPWLSNFAKAVYVLLAASLIVFASIFVSLQLKRRRAELVLKTRNDFLSILSHEIRTPLTGVIGMLQMILKERRLSPKALEHVRLGHMNAQALLNITNDILNINKIASDGIAIEKVNFNLILMLKTATSAFSEIAEGKGLLLSLFIADDVPEFVVADPHRIRQVLTNLVSNSLKFTKHGSISIHIRKRLFPDDAQLFLEVEVTDTGIGMPPEALAKLFEKYEQAQVSTTRLYGGSGLGLSICKSLVTAMGGEISAESREGRGSLFTFIVPIAIGIATDPEQGEQLKTQHAYRLNILCAEDFETNQMIIRQFVEEMGHDMTLVENGIEALEALMARHYDLVLMDGRMPKMDGTAACTQIRSGTWNKKIIQQRDIPIIALTANITQADKEGYLRAGVNAIVGKPIDKGELFQAIENVIQDLLAKNIPLNPQTRPDDPFSDR